MQNKNNVILFSVVFLIVGAFIGWSVGNNKTNNSNGMHQMPNGEMMSNVPMDMSNMMDGMMAGLQGKTGKDFDKAFISEMIVHHKGAVVMAEAVLKNSQNPELIKLAKDIISAQTKEIGMMEGWQNTWFK